MVYKNSEEKLKSELEEFKKIFDKEIKDFLEKLQPKTIIDYLGYYINDGGKRIRPFIFYKVVKDFLNKNVFEDENLKKIMFSIEIYHNSLLIIDDLQDNDEKRREKLSLWKIVGKNQAINIGFYGLNLVENIINNLDVNNEVKLKLINYYNLVNKKTLEGQILDLAVKRKIKEIEYKMEKGEIDEKELEEKKEFFKKIYCRTILLKTGYYMLLPFLLAIPFILDKKEEYLNKLKKEFLIVGSFFQIMNDFEDLFGKKNDLKEGFLTLPYLILIEKNIKNFIKFLKKDESLINQIKNYNINKKVAKKMEIIGEKEIKNKITSGILSLIIKKIESLH